MLIYTSLIECTMQIDEIRLGSKGTCGYTWESTLLVVYTTMYLLYNGSTGQYG